MLTLVVCIVALALLFDFLNGMNDAANSVATVVLSPRIAVLWAAFFNFVAAFGFEVKVAGTVGKGIVHPTVVDPFVVSAALGSAIVWTYLCTAFGLPISVSHSIIGALAGAGLAKGGLKAVIPQGIAKVAAFIVISPLLGMALGWLLMVLVFWVFRRVRSQKIDRLFRVG